MVFYYKKKIPSIDDIVIAKVENISEYGIEVSLNEYNGLKGFININETSRKKKVNLNILFTIGKDIMLIVIQVDENKKYIDLSKRMISDDDIKFFSLKYKFHIQLYNLFKQLYMKLNNFTSLEHFVDDELYNYMCCTLFELQQQHENAYLFEKILNKEMNLEIIQSINFDSWNFNQDEFMKILNEHIDTKVNKKKPELVETIKLKTYNTMGLYDIKYSMDYKNFNEYLELSKDFDIKINYSSCSCYSIILLQKDYELIGSNSINDAISIIKKEISKRANEKNILNQIIVDK